MTRETHPSIAQSGTEPETERNGTERRRSDLDSDSNPIRAFGRSSVADAMDAGATTDATCGEEINETDATTRRRRRSVEPPIGRNRPNADPSNADRKRRGRGDDG